MEIAQIDEVRRPSGTAGMVVIGVVLMALGFFLDTSAIRVISYAAVWTGWNVLALMLMLSQPRRYRVTREVDGPPSAGR